MSSPLGKKSIHLIYFDLMLMNLGMSKRIFYLKKLSRTSKVSASKLRKFLMQASAC